jgi:L-fuconolactonase
MKIDTHQHFWKYNSTQYPWMGESMGSLRRDYLPSHLAPLLEAASIDGTVSVQARQVVEESYWLLELADQNPFIKGVVGWVDLCSPKVAEQLEELARYPKLRGVRHVIHDEPDDRFMMREDFRRGLSQLNKYKLTYDLLLFPRHLPIACELLKLFPEQPFVLDHIAKPLIKERKLEPWRTDLTHLAKFTNVYCKVSGMVTEAAWADWQRQDFSPYLDVVFESFGTKRIMIGSDWPVCTLAGTYSRVIQIVSEYLHRLSRDEQTDVWSGNAKRFYGLGD